MTIRMPRQVSPSGHAVYSMGAGAKTAEPAENSADYVWEVRAAAGKQLKIRGMQLDVTVGTGDTLRRKVVREYADGTTDNATGNQSNASSTTVNFGPQAFITNEPSGTKRVVAFRLYAWHDSATVASSVDATRADIEEI